jgi:3-phenylpropionate/trans-cinnamate dioxygenase ferredoxin reductase subunit
VRYLRTLEDARGRAEALRGLAARGGRAVVVGGGFIGAEVASACRTLGVAVTVVEPLSTLLNQALGDDVGAIFTSIHRERGVELRLGESVAALRGAGRVEEVLTASGTRLACDLAVVGIGVRPADEWLRGSELTLGNGVVVDEYCATSVPGIFAAGDVASWPYLPTGDRIRVEHFDNALRQGEAAARSMLGERRPYTLVPYFWSDQYDLKIQMVGLAYAWDLMVLRGRPGDGTFLAFYLQAGRLRAALAVNRPRDLATLKRLVAVAPTPDPARLADEDVALKTLGG